jgi:transcription initiation factor TFIIIB Brf1 subunit/transcription initiation factor TFIIB
MDRCPHPTTVFDRGSAICTACGLVLEDFIPEDASFVDFERCAAGPVEESKSHQKRMERAKTFINSFTAQLHMSDALNATAIQVFGDCIDSSVLSKKKMEVRCAACVYCAAKLQGFDRSEEDIASTLGFPKKEFRQCMVAMRASLAHKPYGMDLLTTVSAERLVQRMLDRLRDLFTSHNIDRNHVLKAFYQHIHKLDTTKGKKPQNVCASVLCHVLRQSYGLSIQEVSDHLQIGCINISADIR